MDERPEIPWLIGKRRDEQAGETGAWILYAPMNDIVAPSFSSGEHEDNTAIWRGMAVSVPCDKVLPRIVVHFGLIIGLQDAERRKYFLWRAARTLVQLYSSSYGSPYYKSLLPQYISFASFATTPS